ncbi:hypothetical protein MMC15_006353 [Xylographa vitiligo]|nr:hypothetical protein [Xylographa vitiligo]
MRVQSRHQIDRGLAAQPAATGLLRDEDTVAVAVLAAFGVAGDRGLFCGGAEAVLDIGEVVEVAFGEESGWRCGGEGGEREDMGEAGKEEGDRGVWVDA